MYTYYIYTVYICSCAHIVYTLYVIYIKPLYNAQNRKRSYKVFRFSSFDII